jgi:hypothetical protein
VFLALTGASPPSREWPGSEDRFEARGHLALFPHPVLGTVRFPLTVYVRR